MWQPVIISGADDLYQPMDGYDDIFPAKITAVTPGTGNFAGYFLYSWTEQLYNPLTGGYSASFSGRVGTAALSPAFELNNNGTVSINTLVWMRLKAVINGQVCYEFEASASYQIIQTTNISNVTTNNTLFIYNDSTTNNYTLYFYNGVSYIPLSGGDDWTAQQDQSADFNDCPVNAETIDGEVWNNVWHPVSLSTWCGGYGTDGIFANFIYASPQIFPRGGTLDKISICIQTATGGTSAVSAVIANGGTGYTVGDIVTLSGGTFSVAAQFTVASISGGGGTGPIATVTLHTAGTYSTFPLNPVSVTGGTGNSATLTVLWNANMQFGIYTNKATTATSYSRYPGDLVYQSPLYPVATEDTFPRLVIDTQPMPGFSFEPGVIYWFAMQFQTGGQVLVFPTNAGIAIDPMGIGDFEAVSAPSGQPIGAGYTYTTSGPGIGLVYTVDDGATWTGSLPSTFPANATIFTGSAGGDLMPAMHVKFRYS